jgi:hypothetical protein
VEGCEVHRYVALRDEKEVRRNVKTRINKINDDGVMFGSFLITTLRIISILHRQNKITFKLTVRASPINNGICTLLF